MSRPAQQQDRRRTDPDARIELAVERVVAGGLGLGREPSGRVVLVEGAMPGERVAVALHQSKPKLARGRVVEVLDASAGRIAEPCPELALGCGGCDLQFADPSLQRQIKVDIVSDALARIGRLRDVPVSAGEVLATDGYRTTLRCGVRDGRAGFRKRRSNEIHVVDSCWIAHPLVREIVEQGRFPGADEVTIRVGARTGERLVVVSPRVGDAVVPDGVRLVGTDELAAASSEDSATCIHEIVARRHFRVSASSFFQSRPDGAEALVRAVARSIDTFDVGTDRFVDLYGGVGLFTLGLGARRATLVERSGSSVRDAEVNLAELGTLVERSDVDAWQATPAEVVVADPARAGLGAAGAERVVATGADRVALVSCDPAALARDARLLVDAGYEVRGVELVDMFPQTHHVEAVTSLRRLGAVS